MFCHTKPNVTQTNFHKLHPTPNCISPEFAGGGLPNFCVGRLLARISYSTTKHIAMNTVVSTTTALASTTLVFTGLAWRRRSQKQ